MRITWGLLPKKEQFNPVKFTLRDRIAQHKKNHPNDRTFES